MLNKVRNYVQGQGFHHIKKLVAEYGLEAFPTMTEIIKIVNRDPLLIPPPEDASQAVKDAHEALMKKAVWYVNCFLAQVAGASTWWRPAIRKSMTISQATYEGKACVPINTEAMAALFFENGATADPGAKDEDGNPLEGKWYEYFKLSSNCTNKVMVPRSRQGDKEGKYEGRYSSSKSGSSTFGGWSDEGLIRYEVWMDQVDAARKREHSEAVEQAILKRIRMDCFGLTAENGGGDDEGSRKKKAKKSGVKLSLRV